MFVLSDREIAVCNDALSNENYAGKEDEEAAPQTYKIQTSYIRLRRQAGLSKLVSQRQSLVGYLFVVITGSKGSDFVGLCARS